MKARIPVLATALLGVSAAVVASVSADALLHDASTGAASTVSPGVFEALIGADVPDRGILGAPAPPTITMPDRGLFDVVLEPGVPVFRTVTVRNDDDRTLLLAVGAELQHDASSDHRAHEILFTGSPSRRACDQATVEFDTTTLHAAHTMPAGSIPARTSSSVCLGVLLPEGAAEADSRTVVDLTLSTAVDPTRRLAYTGTSWLWALALASTLVSAGAFLRLLRRRPPQLEKDLT